EPDLDQAATTILGGRALRQPGEDPQGAPRVSPPDRQTAPRQVFGLAYVGRVVLRPRAHPVEHRFVVALDRRDPCSFGPDGVEHGNDRVTRGGFTSLL